MTSFVVYGTLREGGGAEQLWTGRASARPAVLDGYELLDTGRGYPIVRPRAGARCVVDVLTVVDGADEPRLVDELDRYEEVPHEYLRVSATVTTDGGDTIEGWLYVGVPDAFDRLVAIPSGDWLRR